MHPVAFSGAYAEKWVGERPSSIIEANNLIKSRKDFREAIHHQSEPIHLCAMTGARFSTKMSIPVVAQRSDDMG